MRTLISGSGGLIGRTLGDHLRKKGHQVIPLRRGEVAEGEEALIWEPIRSQTWERDIGPIDAVVHLAGENIAAQRWTSRVKQRIRDSRVRGTEQLCRHLAMLREKPQVIIAASAVGYYGDRGDEILTEASPPGDGFLADVCRDWETACGSASEAGIRVVNLRLGTVLARDGGALSKLLPIFRLGFGGRLGSGKQWVSWIALDDLIGIVDKILADTTLAGPVNAVSPNPVRNTELTRVLASVLRRPAFMAVPSSVLRTALGEMADPLLLGSARVMPKRLTEVGFSFRHPDLFSTLRHVLDKNQLASQPRLS